ncbi:hypothetical protein [Oleiagrimonas sp. C23AA]|uniref:hypothetical protein n=1 Tax=Oleiagrimonas sp. C23AA TaxID=2719047 RepID=UPI0014211752|nr:hypothetical protein [Oleiagrimonas sp. C23AA]NII10806.1 hypothetical protein [Oleiagrimonas sp. C23AA]
MPRSDVRPLGEFSYIFGEHRVPADHPIHKRRGLVDVIPGDLDELLAARFAAGGQPSIPTDRRLSRVSSRQLV